MYGFVPEAPTPHDRVELEGAFCSADMAAAPGDSVMLEEKRALLRSCRYESPRTFPVAARKIDPAIICALRLLFLTPAELTDECEGNWNRPLLHAPLSRSNERRVANALRARLQALLRAEPTSLEEDVSWLEAAAVASEAGNVADSSVGALDAAMATEEAGEDSVEELRYAVQLRANKKTLLAELTRQLDLFISEIETVASDPEAPVPNLLDCVDDYLPNMRLL